MKRTTFILILLCLPTFSLLAQSFKNTFSLSAGPSFPVGKLGHTALSDYSAGNAKTGISAGIAYTYRLKNNFGIEAMLFGQSNALNTASLERQLVETGFFREPIPGSPRFYGNWKMEGKKWYAGALLIGISKQLPFGQKGSKLSIIPKAMFGMGWMQSPELYAISKADTAYAIFERSKGTSIVPVFILDASLKYQLNNRIGIHFGLAFFNSGKASFKNRISKITASNGGLLGTVIVGLENSKDPPISFESSQDYQLSLQSFNPKIGIDISF